MKIKWLLAIISVVLFAATRTDAQAQGVALKTNFLYWGTATPNAGIEVGLAPKWTFSLSGGFNPFTFADNKKFKHWSAVPEFRLWTCEAFNGHFFGLHGVVGQYNVGNWNIPFWHFKHLKDYRYEGWAYGAGLTYGYQFVLGKNWNLEASLSLGYAYLDYRKFNCVKCGKMVDEGGFHYLGPTKATLSIVYMLK